MACSAMFPLNKAPLTTLVLPSLDFSSFYLFFFLRENALMYVCHEVLHLMEVFSIFNNAAIVTYSTVPILALSSYFFTR
jgi:hypothetical protein